MDAPDWCPKIVTLSGLPPKCLNENKYITSNAITTKTNTTNDKYVGKPYIVVHPA